MLQYWKIRICDISHLKSVVKRFEHKITHTQKTTFKIFKEFKIF